MRSSVVSPVVNGEAEKDYYVSYGLRPCVSKW
jgi:hypothetical protein